MPGRLFQRYAGIDYSGAGTPETGLTGLRVFLAEAGGEPVEIRPETDRRRHWSRRQVHLWLAELLAEGKATLVGLDHGLFQGAHGSAPDIAGQDAASPLATILSAALMLRWLGDRHADERLRSAADRIEKAVEEVLAAGQTVPHDQGGTARCSEVTQAVCRHLG